MTHWSRSLAYDIAYPRQDTSPSFRLRLSEAWSNIIARLTAWATR